MLYFVAMTQNKAYKGPVAVVEHSVQHGTLRSPASVVITHGLRMQPVLVGM